MTLSAVIIDTFERNAFPRYAIEMALKTRVVDEIITLSVKGICSGEKFIKINPIESIFEYNNLILDFIPRVVNSSHYLVIQWDGFPVNPDLWSKDFLEYDYIGAPWYKDGEDPTVGNGGFSMRSRCLNSAILNNSNYFCDYEMPEDELICRTNRKLLENYGVKFANFNIADNFSFESGEFRRHFGFHGVFNLPYFIEEDFLCENVLEIFQRTSNEMIYIELIINTIKNKKYNFLELIINNLLANQSKYPLVIKYLQHIKLVK